MRKKYQVFVSSTYLDLKEDRQAAVEAILAAGHIPAGMELFAAGNESQLNVIKRWIDESDIYMLILGGRYGSIEPNSGKSYIHLEYEYALEKEKPVFAVVIRPELLDERVNEYGESVLESENLEKYNAFKNIVLSKNCEFYNDLKDIKIAVLKTLNDFSNRLELSGWVRYEDVYKLNFENQEQKEELNGMKKILKNLKDTVTQNEGSSSHFVSLEKNKFIATLFIGSIGYVVNGKALTAENAPFIYKGIVLVPIKIIAEILGAEIEYDSAMEMIFISHPEKTITLTIGSNVITDSDGNVIVSDIAPIILKEELFLPFRVIGEMFGLVTEAVFAEDGTINAIIYSNE